MSMVLLLSSGALAQSVTFVCNDGDRSVVGVAPFEVSCEVRPPSVGTWSGVRWRLGDGETAEGDRFTYTYDEPGMYTVSVSLLDYEPSPDGRRDLERRRDGTVTACGEPEPRFDYVNKGGRDYQMINLTPVATPRCLRTLHWAVYRGARGGGEPLYEFETWQPRFELPEDGPYLVEYTVDALGGSVTTSARIEAEYALTEEYKPGQSTSCSSVGGVGGLWWAALPLLAILRRREPST